MPRPLASFPLAKTNETDEAQAVLSRELSELRFRSVRSRSQFEFGMNGVHLGQTTVAYNQFSTEVDVDAGTIENAVIVSISTGPPTVLEVDGEIVTADRVGIVSPCRKVKIHRSPDSGVLFLRAGLEAIHERARQLTGNRLQGPIVFERSTHLRYGIGAQISGLLNYLVADAANTNTILANPILRRGLDDMLLNAILALPTNYGDVLQNQREPQTASRKIVDQAEGFIERCAADPITIADVVAACDCSRRGLFQAFQKHRMYSPMMFLTEVRLKAAHEALKQAGPNDSVTSIALRYGFLHLGRFAARYRTRFGEKPSETMRRI